MDSTDDTWGLSDHDSWHDEENYNRAVALALRFEHTCRSQRTALATLRDALKLTMSARQRMRVLARIAIRLAPNDPPTIALSPLDDALELALHLEELTGQTDLLLLRASINRAILQVPDSADDLRDVLMVIALREEKAPLPPGAKAKRLEALLNLAGLEFATGAFESAKSLLDQAARMMRYVPESGLHRPLLLWTQALLWRWTNQTELALTAAMAAANDYYVNGAPGNASRIQTLVADIAMDLAERFQRAGQSQASDAFLVLADGYIVRALELARQAKMESSEVMAVIASLRWQLLRGDPEDRKPALLELAATAYQHQDMALVAQAYTALGREYEADGDLGSATACYERVLATLRESRMAALGVWAQRALWRIRGEMEVKSPV